MLFLAQLSITSLFMSHLNIVIIKLNILYTWHGTISAALSRCRVEMVNLYPSLFSVESMGGKNNPCNFSQIQPMQINPAEIRNWLIHLLGTLVKEIYLSKVWICILYASVLNAILLRISAFICRNLAISRKALSLNLII